MTAFSQLAALAEELAGESARLKKRAAIADAISAVHNAAPKSEDAGLFAQYLAGAPFAEADARKLNVGGALLSRALLAVSEASQAALTAAYKRHGDLGAAGYDLMRGTHRKSGPRLTLAEVAEAFADLAAARTVGARTGLVEGLLRRASPLEAKYLLKLMAGDMRIGVKQSLIEEAIAVAAHAHVAAVRNAVMLEANLSTATKRAFAGTLNEATMRLFHPLGFMLASPVDSPEEAVERFAANPEEGDESNHITAFLEDKYDGMRAQIHAGDPTQPGRVAIYSRNREDVTESFPELEEAFARVSEASGALIFDGEILGWDFETARALPFALLGTRLGRKRVTNGIRTKVPVIFMAFDLLYADNELLLEHPLHERRSRLESAAEKLAVHVTAPIIVDELARNAQAVLFAGEESAAFERLLLAPSRHVQGADDIERAYADARSRANEGVMLKAANSIYQPGRRGLSWLKLKRELATLDVVVTGAEFGHGKRAGILSDYIFAVRGAHGELLNVGKAYSGLTDAEIAEMSAWMMAHTLVDEGFFRTVEPLRILEVAFNNIMRSDRHASGFALRFPRILRIRDDKPVSEVDTVERVEDIYESQVDKPVE